ncbi:MAG TPA: carboxypeptidase-like regulatory domain-containing protein, partial [Chitinophagales bacterium]
MRRYIFSAFLTLFSIAISAQQNTFAGVVVDGATGYTMSYVDVVFLKTQEGNFTDEEGAFHIDISGLNFNDSVVFSHLGYEEFRTTIGNVLKTSSVVMKPKDFTFGEVVVSPLDALSYIKLARSKIADNYPTTYSNTHLIFKDFSKRSGHKSHYYYFDLDMYLQSYTGTKMSAGWKVNKHELYDKKRELNPSMNPTQLLPAVQLENFLDDKKLAENDYKFLSQTTFEGEDLTVIAFTRKPDKRTEFVRVEGKIFISQETKAFRFFELHVHNTKSKRFMLVAKMDSLNMNVKMAFKKQADTNVLDYIAQTTYLKGSLFGKSENLNYSTTAKVLSTELN